MTRTRGTIAASFCQAERTGFEPVDGCYPVTGLANRRYRPLSHLSKECYDKRLRQTEHPAEILGCTPGCTRMKKRLHR